MMNEIILLISHFFYSQSFYYDVKRLEKSINAKNYNDILY